MENVQVFAIKIFINGYEQLIYTTADNIKVKHDNSLVNVFDAIKEKKEELTPEHKKIFLFKAL